MRRLVSISLAFTQAVVVACSESDSSRVPLAQTVASDSAQREREAHSLLGPKAQASLDSGNVLFRKHGYAEALAQYRAAAELAPQHAAPLFGIYMVARATNDKALADSALAQIRLRNGPTSIGPHDFSDTALRRIHDSVRRRPPIT